MNTQALLPGDEYAGTETWKTDRSYNRDDEIGHKTVIGHKTGTWELLRSLRSLSRRVRLCLPPSSSPKLNTAVVAVAVAATAQYT